MPQMYLKLTVLSLALSRVFYAELRTKLLSFMIQLAPDNMGALAEAVGTVLGTVT
jgi:hypothetical protein